MWSLLWYRFNPWPQNLCTVWLQPKRKKRKKRKRPEKRREEKKEGRASKQAQRLQSLPKVFEIRCQPTSPQSLSAFPYTVPPLLYNVTNILNSKLLFYHTTLLKKKKKKYWQRPGRKQKYVLEWWLRMNVVTVLYSIFFISNFLKQKCWAVD